MNRHIAEKVSPGADWGAFTIIDTMPPRDPDDEEDDEEEEDEEEDRRVDEPAVVREPDEN